MEIIRFNEIGRAFGNRKQAEEVRKKIETNLDRNNSVIFDFSGVEIITSSFADECFAKLIETRGMNFIKSKTKFVNVNQNVSFVITSSINKRTISK